MEISGAEAAFFLSRAVFQSPASTSDMHPTKYILWEEQGLWRGYLKDHPDQVEQGKSFEELQAKLRRLQRDLSRQEHDTTDREHDRHHDHAVEVPYPMPHRTKTNPRLETLFASMVATLG
jgi:hypothetical protein